MRNLQTRLTDALFAEQNNVEVQRTGPVGEAFRPVASKFLFNGEKTFEKRARRQLGFQPDDRIHKTRLVGIAHGLGGVKRRASDEAAERLKSFRSGDQSLRRRASTARHISAHRDVSRLHTSRLIRPRVLILTQRLHWLHGCCLARGQ